MSEGTSTTGRLDPSVLWTVLTDAPLRGLCMAREAGVILAWDEADHLLLFDILGERRTASRSPSRITAAAISDDGTLVAVLVEGERLLLLDQDLAPLNDRPAVSGAHALTVDPHGRYIAVATKHKRTQFYTRHGKPAGRFETLQPLAHLRFVPDRAMLLGASAYGSLIALDLAASGPSGSLSAEENWKVQLLSNVGDLTTTGDGGMILVSCYTHGVQRYDNRGHNEGAYHLGGTASHAVPDFAGRTIAVATTEGELAILNSAGNIRWKTGLPRPILSLECDALGRSVLYGLPTGEITRLDLTGTGKPSTATGTSSPARSGSIRKPVWTAPVVQTDEQAESAVLAVIDDPPRIGLLTNRNQLQLFTQTGGSLGQAPEIVGVGRILRTAPGWIVAATDRQVVLYDAHRNGSQRLDLSLVELTHLAVRPDTYGLALIQERDRIGRASLAGRWVWRHELRNAVEDLAIGPENLTAVTTDIGQLLIFDPAGAAIAQYSSEPAEPLALSSPPRGAPPEVCWLTLARRAQVLRGHRRDGRVLWESPIPWEAWQLHAIGPVVVVESVDGRALAFDGTGHARVQSRAEAAPGLFYAGPQDQIRRIVRQGEHLICSELSGRVIWRAIADAPIGPFAASRTGVAALIGRSLAWFAEQEGDPSE